jgi:hypothetical protein
METVLIPVMQTRFGNEEGNCFAASIASILEMKLEDIPELHSGINKHWFPILWDFLIKHKYTFYGTLHKEEDILAYDKGVKGYYLVSGDSPRGCARGHAVVYYKGKLAHDPYPNGNGVTKIWHALMIEPQEENCEIPST